MKKVWLFCALVFLPLSYSAAQQAQSITDVIADTAANYLSPFGGKGLPGEKLLILHFRAPTTALNDWAVDRFTEVFKQRGTAPVERRNRPALLAAIGEKTDAELDDAAAVSLGAQTGVRTVFTGAFTPSGRNWALSIRAISVADKKMVWSKNYLVQPGEVFTQLASPPPAPLPAPAAAAPVPVSSAPVPAAAGPAPVSSAPVPVAAASAVAAPAGPTVEDLAEAKKDLMTEAAHIAAMRKYREFVGENFPNISISGPYIENIRGSNPFKISYTWQHTDKIPVVRAMADFFQALADVNQGEPYTTAFKYYQTDYANTTQEISFKTFPIVRRALDFIYTWDLEFTLFDKAGNTIDTHKAAFTRTMPFGKGTNRGNITFYLIEEAHSMMDTLRLTKITMR
ncbi:MAG: hypothetical protein LBB78_11335 [Spirochaetaceae bacterium]|nr:hypothetical protein [Spirochaetaceae bacterium]